MVILGLHKYEKTESTLIDKTGYLFSYYLIYQPSFPFGNINTRFMALLLLCLISMCKINRN